MTAPAIFEVDELVVWTVTDNVYDSNRADTPIARRYRALPGRSIHAEHGLSFVVEARVGTRRSACVLDFGLDPTGVANNLRLLGLDLADAAAFVLSHGHYDHYLAAVELLGRVRSRLRPGTPFYVGQEAFAHRWSLRPGAMEPSDLGQLAREDLERLGLEVVEVRGTMEVVPGLYSTGPIERVTAYERVPESFRIRRGDRTEHDTFPGEHALFCALKGKGLVVLTGCAHAGIVNTLLHARRAAGTGRVHAVLGGFHLAGASEDLVERTVADLAALEPDHVVPAHCTGFEAVVAVRAALPRAFVLGSAGTRYTFSA